MDKTFLRLSVIIILSLALSACSIIQLPFGRGSAGLDIATGVSDGNGLARVESAAGVVEFQVTSGLSGERMTGVRVRMAVFGDSRLLIAEDPTGNHLPVAVPVDGEARVRRLVMPPTSDVSYNLTSAAGTIRLRDLTPLESTLDETALRSRLRGGGESSVLLYLYNPARPLALTNAALEVYETPFENVSVLRAPGEPEDAQLAIVVASIGDDAYEKWTHRNIDRYLAGRIGELPATDLRGDLAFRWSYPVYDVFPDEEPLAAGEGEAVTFRVNWRSQNPDPPPPWSFFVSVDSEMLSVEPEAFSLDPQAPPAEVTVNINRDGLAAGEYEAMVFIQPFSEAFGMIEQRFERAVTFTVGQAEPTPTPGPQAETLTIDPEEPRVGQTMTVTAGGFNPGEPVLLEFVGEEHAIRDSLQLADDTGLFTYVVDLTPVPPGSYTLTLTGSESGVSGQSTVSVGESVPDAVVTSAELNVRTGPGYEYPAIDVLVTGDTMTVIAVNWDDTWLEVQTSTGRQGWVVRDLVELNISLDDIPWNSNFPNPDA